MVWGCVYTCVYIYAYMYIYITYIHDMYTYIHKHIKIYDEILISHSKGNNKGQK